MTKVDAINCMVDQPRTNLLNSMVEQLEIFFRDELAIFPCEDDDFPGLIFHDHQEVFVQVLPCDKPQDGKDLHVTIDVYVKGQGEDTFFLTAFDEQYMHLKKSLVCEVIGTDFEQFCLKVYGAYKVCEEYYDEQNYQKTCFS